MLALAQKGSAMTDEEAAQLHAALREQHAYHEALEAKPKELQAPGRQRATEHWCVSTLRLVWHLLVLFPIMVYAFSAAFGCVLASVEEWPAWVGNAYMLSVIEGACSLVYPSHASG